MELWVPIKMKTSIETQLKSPVFFSCWFRGNSSFLYYTSIIIIAKHNISLSILLLRIGFVFSFVLLSSLVFLSALTKIEQSKILKHYFAIITQDKLVPERCLNTAQWQSAKEILANVCIITYVILSQEHCTISIITRSFADAEHAREAEPCFPSFFNYQVHWYRSNPITKLD